MHRKEWNVLKEDGTYEKIKVTEQDLIDAVEVNENIETFINSKEFSRCEEVYYTVSTLSNETQIKIKDGATIVKNGLTIDEKDIKLYDKYNDLFDKYKNTPEERITRTVEKTLERAIDERRTGNFRFARANSNSGYRSSTTQTGHSRFSYEKTITETISQREVEKSNQQNVKETKITDYDEIPDFDDNKTVEENIKVIANSAYKEDGKVKIIAEYEMLEDEQGEYYGVARFVIQDLDENGDWKNHVPLTPSAYKNIEERDLFKYSQFDGADVAFLAMYDDETWETIEKYLEENPDASFREIQFYVGK